MSGFHQLLLDGNSGQFTTNPHLLTKTHFISFSLNIYTEATLPDHPSGGTARLNPPSMGFEATKRGIMFCNGVATIWHLKLIAEFHWIVLLLQKSYPLMQWKDFTLHGKCPHLIVSPSCFVHAWDCSVRPRLLSPLSAEVLPSLTRQNILHKSIHLEHASLPNFLREPLLWKRGDRGRADGVVFVVRLLLYWWLRSWSNDKLLNS